MAGGDGVYVRRALESDVRSPVAFVFAFSDIEAMIASSKTGVPARPTGYVVVTTFGTVDTLWRAYEALPSDAQFEADLDAGLAGRAPPIASVDFATKQVNILIGKKRG